MLRFVTPPTEDDLLHHWDAFRFLHREIEDFVSLDDFRAVLLSCVGQVSLVYLDDLLIGCFIAEAYTNSVELHGVSRADLKLLIGRQEAVRLMDTIHHSIFKRVFLDAGKEKVVVKVFKGSKGGLGFVRRFGFTKLPNTDKGRTVWRLDREKYLQEAGYLDG